LVQELQASIGTHRKEKGAEHCYHLKSDLKRDNELKKGCDEKGERKVELEQGEARIVTLDPAHDLARGKKCVDQIVSGSVVGRGISACNDRVEKEKGRLKIAQQKPIYRGEYDEVSNNIKRFFF